VGLVFGAEVAAHHGVRFGIRLRVGLSSTVTVDTTDRHGPVLAGKAEDQPVGDTQVYTQDLAQANAEADAVVSRNLGAED